MKLCLFLCQFVILYTAHFAFGLHGGQDLKEQQILESSNEVSSQDKRILPSTFRLGVDTSGISVLEKSTDLKQQVLNIMNLASQFFKDLIQIVSPLTKKIEISNNCQGYTYTSSQIQQGFSGVDLQLLVNVQIDSSIKSRFAATSQVCQRSDQSFRPVIGIIKITLNDTTILSHFHFQQSYKKIIHEIAHILAFDSTSIFNFRDIAGQYYDQSLISFSSQSIALPKTLTWARNYFNCPSLSSVPIEISSTEIHWNRALLLDDIMSGLFSQGEGLWSGINNAFLEDSGWYKISISMKDTTISWGRDRGCLFVNNGCSSYGSYFPEFCLNEGNIGMTLSRKSMGSCQKLFSPSGSQYSATSSKLKNCLFMMPVSNRVCGDTQNQQLSENKYLVNEFFYNFNFTSRSFVSSLTPIQYESYNTVACYTAICSSENNSITIVLSSTMQFTCNADSETVQFDKPFQYTGQINCPSNISAFCQQPAYCPSYCSSRGYCFNNSCVCFSNYSGKGCECEQGKYYNEKLQTCRSCSSNCLTCNSSEDSICSSCYDGYYLNSNTCQACDPSCLTCQNSITCSTCSSGYFLDPSSQLCQKCSDNCQICTSIKKCTQCYEGYGFDSEQAACSFVCNYQCKRCQITPLICIECTLPRILTSDQKCQCPDSYYENELSTCSACSSNCQKCTSSSECTECIQETRLLPIQQTCYSSGIMIQFKIYFLLIALSFFLQ